MTELPTLQAALRETAERTYPRRRRPLVPALLVAAAAAAAVLVMQDRETEQPAREVAATPAPTTTPVPTPPPGVAPAIPTRPPADQLQKADRIRIDDPSLKDLVGAEQTIVRAWIVPEFQGHVILSRKGRLWCLSMPDPASAQPDVQRAESCTGGSFEREGIALFSGDYYAEVAPTHGGTARGTGPDGKTRTIKLHGSDLVFAHGKAGVEYRLSQMEPGIG